MLLSLSLEEGLKFFRGVRKYRICLNAINLRHILLSKIDEDHYFWHGLLAFPKMDNVKFEFELIMLFI